MALNRNDYKTAIPVLEKKLTEISNNINNNRNNNINIITEMEIDSIFDGIPSTGGGTTPIGGVCTDEAIPLSDIQILLSLSGITWG